MNSSYLPRNKSVYLLFLALAAVLTWALPRKARFGYEFSKGETWNYPTVTAQFDFPILKTDFQLSREKSEESLAENDILLKYDDAVVPEALRQAESYDSLLTPVQKSALLETLSELYSRGVVEDGTLPEDASVIHLRKGKHTEAVPASDVYTVLSARDKLYSVLFPLVDNSVNLGALMEEKGIDTLVRPNLLEDKEGVWAVSSPGASSHDVSPTRNYLSAGEVIVREGDIITSETYQNLLSYKAEFESSVGYSGPLALVWLGNGLFAVLFALLVFMALLYGMPEAFGSWNKLLYILFCCGAFMLIAIVVGKSGSESLYRVPFSLLCLYFLPFFRRRLILPLYLVTLLPLLLFGTAGFEAYFIYLAAAVVTIAAFKTLGSGWKQFIMASAVFAAMFLVLLAFRFLDGSISYRFPADKTLSLLIGAFLPIAGYPLVLLLEKVFGLLSEGRLQDLCNTNEGLLRELSVKAPGTFQHSLAVMNMADAAARSIGANIMLVRAGAMYHDIGKLSDPLCFVENQQIGSVSYHDTLNPVESARRILRHVPDGVELARKHNLHEDIVGFIRSHHGVSCAAYFYNKFLAEGGSPDEKYRFTYSGVKPSTKEQGILMICDSVEAASRTLSDNSRETFDDFVEKMVSSKISDGQLDESGLTLGDLRTIKTVLKDYLGQLYHDRVEYPEEKK